MAIFAKFVMRDSGRPMFVNAHYVEQVRDTDEPGMTAVYLSGRGTPVVVEETLEVVMKQLAGAPAPLKLVPNEPAPAAEVEAPAAVAAPAVAAAEPAATPVAASAKSAAKAKPAAKKTKPKAVKTVSAPAKPVAVRAKAGPFDTELEPVKWAARF
ncbi:MAG TPA: hypothetical protein VGH15_09045 [Caulobacteraceae bacterium]|jgi:uncharacterized protein YlzI (FlbEa/FlbD family)